MSEIQSVDSETDTEDENELVIVMDNYAGHWTPFAVMRSNKEAQRLKEMLSHDGEADIGTAPWFDSKEDVLNKNEGTPDTSADEVAVGFKGCEPYAISTDDIAVREMQSKRGGYRKMANVYDTAEEVAIEQPQSVSNFIVDEMSDEEIKSFVP